MVCRVYEGEKGSEAHDSIATRHKAAVRCCDAAAVKLVIRERRGYVFVAAWNRRLGKKQRAEKKTVSS